MPDAQMTQGRGMTRQQCIELLRQVSRELRARGETRYPRRSDLPEAAVVAVKARLGPWPRALEAAGLKPPRGEDRIARNREKRIRAKRRRREALRTDAGSGPGRTWLSAAGRAAGKIDCNAPPEGGREEEES